MHTPPPEDQQEMCCPFHTKVSYGVRLFADDGFLCLDCGAHGDAIIRLMMSDGVSYLEATARFRG
jgi:hypothetical protein